MYALKDCILYTLKRLVGRWLGEDFLELLKKSNKKEIKVTKNEVKISPRIVKKMQVSCFLVFGPSDALFVPPKHLYCVNTYLYNELHVWGAG